MALSSPDGRPQNPTGSDGLEESSALLNVAVRSRSQVSSKSAANHSLSRFGSILTKKLNDLITSQTGLTRQCRMGQSVVEVWCDVS
jgi:hypothetical protein